MWADICTSIFTAVLFTTSEQWSQRAMNEETERYAHNGILFSHHECDPETCYKRMNSETLC